LEKYFGSAKQNSISIIYTTEEENERSLDLIAPNEHVYKYLMKTLTSLLKGIKISKGRMSVEMRYLKKKWEGVIDNVVIYIF